MWTLARVACYVLSTLVDICACCVLCAVHFSGHLRVIVCYGFVHFSGRLRVLSVMVLSTFVDTCASCVCYAFVHFCGHLRELCVLRFCPL